MKPIIDKQEIVFETCVQIVDLLKIHVKNDMGTHSRFFNYILHPESKYVHAGVSSNVTENTHNHPEHIVPCAFMIKEVKRLISENELTTTEIATLLKEHWKIVTITKAEAKTLDQDLKFFGAYQEYLLSGIHFRLLNGLLRYDKGYLGYSDLVHVLRLCL